MVITLLPTTTQWEEVEFSPLTLTNCSLWHFNPLCTLLHSYQIELHINSVKGFKYSTTNFNIINRLANWFSDRDKYLGCRAFFLWNQTSMEKVRILNSFRLQKARWSKYIACVRKDRNWPTIVFVKSRAFIKDVPLLIIFHASEKLPLLNELLAKTASGHWHGLSSDRFQHGNWSTEGNVPIWYN